MDTSTQEQTFLTMIKAPCIETCKKYGIRCPSVIAAIGVDISKFGTTKEFLKTRNVYLLPYDSAWLGSVYCKDDEKYYTKASEAPVGSVLYKLYGDHQDSVKAFVEYLATARRSSSGPLTYGHTFRADDYTKFISMLIRAGFMEKYLHQLGETEYHGRIIKIIQDYALYTWDN